MNLTQTRTDTQMKAIVYHEYGSPDVLELEDVEKPTPKDDEVLVKIHASSANAGDWHLPRGEPFLVRAVAGLIKPKNKNWALTYRGRLKRLAAR